MKHSTTLGIRLPSALFCAALLALSAGPLGACRPGWRFDFGTPTSRVAAGYVKVTPTSAYSAKTGYGWLAGSEPIEAVARSSGGALEHDANLSHRATFRVDVPSGFYAVTAIVGDTVAHDPSLVAVEGQALTEFHAPAVGDWPALSTSTHIGDGHVDVTLLAAPRPDADPNPAALINALVIEEIAVPPDPRSWRSGGGTLYRSATRDEIVRNRWPLGTSLVVNRDVRSFGDGTLRVFAPVGPTDGVTARASFVGLEPELPVVELGFGTRSLDRLVAFRRYESSRSPRVVILADADAGAFWGRVEAAGAEPGSGALELRSGEPSWQLDPIPLPSGLAPDPTDLYGVFPGQASRGPGGKVAAPSAGAFGFALVGEIKWCTANRFGWAAALAGRALHVREGFQACPEGACPASTDVDLVQRGLYCNMASSTSAAESCALGGVCPPNASGNQYSYAGCNRLTTCYMENVEANLLQARAEGHTVREIDLAQVIHDGPPQLLVPGIPDSTLVEVCGQASFPSGVDGAGIEAPVGRGGTSIVAASAPENCSLSTSTHEFGHNYAAIHERADETFAGPGCVGTVMTWGPDKCNTFSLVNAPTLSDCSEINNLTLNFGGTAYPGLDQVERRDCPMLDEDPLIPAP